MADHPLRPATDRCLGEPLPHQLANPTRAPPTAINLSPMIAHRAHAVLAEVSLGYPALKGRFPRVTHPSATRLLLDAFDLHVLGMPPAFVLSQDQTLKLACPSPSKPRSRRTQTQISTGRPRHYYSRRIRSGIDLFLLLDAHSVVPKHHRLHIPSHSINLSRNTPR